jgi:lipoprotein-releasing system permease protein
MPWGADAPAAGRTALGTPWLGFELRVALRFLIEGRKQTLLIIVGVAAGVAVIAYISALITGLQGSTLAKTLGAQPHVSLRPPDDLVAQQGGGRRGPHGAG